MGRKGFLIFPPDASKAAPQSKQKVLLTRYVFYLLPPADIFDVIHIDIGTIDGSIR